MAQNHGARQQKKVAKQRAKRAEKRSKLLGRDSADPTIRLQSAEKWPIVRAVVGGRIWEDGIGYLAIARRDSGGTVVFASFLVDVYCLGVKDAFWRAGSSLEFDKLVGNMARTQTMRPIAPACLVKIIKGAVEFAQSFGFPPHPDFRHASMLLAGIDPTTCENEFAFGRDGKPFYIQGLNESPARAAAITESIRGAGGHFIVGGPVAGLHGLPDIEDDFEDDDLDDSDQP
jgi:hypothetical protein